MRSERCFTLCAVLVAATALTVSPSPGQTATGCTTGCGSPGGNAKIGDIGRDPALQQISGQQQQTYPMMRRALSVRGKVLFSDGSPAPPNVAIERVCSGIPIRETYTDSKGAFRFELGGIQTTTADASASGFSTGPMGGPPGFGGAGDGDPIGNSGFSAQELNGCELRASLAGYRSTSIELADRRISGNPDAGQIILTKLDNVEGLTISLVSMQAPKEARKAYDNGMKEAGKKKPNWDKARSQFQKAADAYPQYAEAWYALGQIHETTQKPNDARQAYEQSITADPKFMKPYMKIAMMDARTAQWGEAATRTAAVLKMNPYDFPDAYFLNAFAHLNLNQPAMAEASAREAIKMNYNRQHPQLEQIIGIALAAQSKYQEAAEHLRKYLELAPQAENSAAVKQQIEQLERFLAPQTAQH